MDSTEHGQQYGINATFVSEIPDYLKCVVCQLVLRKPIQIMKCGHRFCETCFDRMKSYSQNVYNELRCPVDQDLIDLNKVFEDNGVNWLISNLPVKCGSNLSGCVWTGDFRHLMDHEKQCKHRNVHVLPGQTSIHEGMGSSVLLQELCQRMLNCEHSLVEKEKYLAFLKFNLQGVKKKFDEKLIEIDFMKDGHKNMEDELNAMKKENIELKQVALKLENISLKNIILEQKVDSLEKQLVLKGQVEENQEEISNISDDDMSSIFENEQMDVTAVNGLLEAFKSSLYEKWNTQASEMTKEWQLTLNGDVKKLKDYLEKSLNEQTLKIETLSCQVTTAQQEVDKKYGILNSKLESSNKSSVPEKTMIGCWLLKEMQLALNEDFKKLNDSLDQSIDEQSSKINKLEDSLGKMSSLQSHVRNIENILFCDLFGSSRDIILQWKVRDVSFDIAMEVYSPIFFTKIKGYRFQLRVGWNIQKDLFAGLLLWRGGNDCNEILQPFDIPYTLELCDRDGNIFSKTQSLASIEESREACFTIHPGEMCARSLPAFAQFLSMPLLLHYLVNDTLSFRCRLRLP